MDDMSLGVYLSGYADGEGCFCITFNKSSRHKFGWDIRPSFSVSQNKDRSQILNLFKERWGCGKIRPDRSDKTVKYEVRSVEDLVKRVIPHFVSYPLLSGKKREFQIFKKICSLLFRKKHLLENGFKQICLLSERMNSSGKKRYPRNKIKI